MQYKDLIQFEPISSVVKLVDSAEKSIAENLVRTFVFSKKIKDDLQAVVVRNLTPLAGNYETKGIQVVGSYGTGKSHLMALVAAIASDASLLPLLNDDAVKDSFKAIAGQYKVLRFEIGTDRPLKDIVFAQIERFLAAEGVEYSFNEDSNFSWKQLLQEMMAAFEEAFPDKHFLLVIDEMLEYLKGRKPTELNNDLMLLRQIGEACDNSRFKIMFGVQELLYRTPEFMFQADMLNKISDRYADLIITRDDVSFVVKERLLKKNVHQKEQIREHLLRFAHLFEGINTSLNEYVDLFPVHPSYIRHFEQISHGKSQREILKVLSHRFEKLLDSEVPHTAPGLITYDTYWTDLAGDPSMLTFPDIRAVRDKVEIITERINNHFTAARSNRKPLATSIANALAIRILCDSLDKRNGATASSLKEDLCYTFDGGDDPEMLMSIVSNTANQIIKATSGQYVDLDGMSSEYFIRTEGGINIPQIVRDYADEVVKRDTETADQYYYEFLQYVLGIQQNSYRTGFKIWQHDLEWIDKKAYRPGYIFFGNPSDRSTTEPIQEFYLFFAPMFTKVNRNDSADEVYFEMGGLSTEFKDAIYLYGAAKAKEGAAPSNQKALFKAQVAEHLEKAISLFEREYADKTTVVYKGVSKMLKAYPLLGDGAPKLSIFSDVASRLLNPHFNDQAPDYPVFRDLRAALSPDNFKSNIYNAFKKIASPATPNREGEAILAGLGLWNGSIDLEGGRYTDALLRNLYSKGEGKVLNREEIIYCHYAPQNLWYATDFVKMEHQLLFVCMAALAYKGDIEISWQGGKTLSATNIDTLSKLTEDDLYSFQHIKEPQGLPVKSLKALFSVLGLPDYSSELDKPDTIAKIITEAKKMVERVVKTKDAVSKGIRCRSVSLLSDTQTEDMKKGLEGLRNLLDNIQAYNTYGKLKSFKWSEEELKAGFSAYPMCDVVEQLEERAKKFEALVGYLFTARNYVSESEIPLYTDISTAIDGLPQVLQADTKDAELKKYEARLTALIDRYADYYIGQYTKYRLSATDALAKERMLQSEDKKVCDIIRDADFISATPYNAWISSISALREGDAQLSKARVKQDPYQEFNPREYAGKPVARLDDLEGELKDIRESWTTAMRSVFKDPGVQEAVALLKPADKTLVESFRDGSTPLSAQNAGPLRRLIGELSKGIEKVEIPADELRRRLSRPLTPNEAITELTDYINELCAGKDRGRVRIILK